MPLDILSRFLVMLLLVRQRYAGDLPTLKSVVERIDVEDHGRSKTWRASGRQS